MVHAAVVVAGALIIDRITGDPHTRLHPVALLGRFIGWWGSSPHRIPIPLQRCAGTVLCLVTASLFAAPFLLVQVYLSGIAYLVAAPFLLKACIGWRSLEDHMSAVIGALESGVEGGREQVRMVVSRDTSSLSHELVLSAAYESMAENLVDSIISPLFYFAIGGLAGAAFFRAVNTMDAMLGYRDERERIGWCAARLDDLLNYIPARIAGLLILAYFGLCGRFRQSYAVLRRDARRRPGINGGIPMAAIAGGVGIRFEKPGRYVIGEPEHTLEKAGGEIIRAVRAVALIFSLIVMAALFLLQTGTNII